jgi:hypothetical protein
MAIAATPPKIHGVGKRLDQSGQQGENEKSPLHRRMHLPGASRLASIIEANLAVSPASRNAVTGQRQV